MRIAGLAYTVRPAPRDNLAVLRAIDRAPPGSVLVVECSDEERVAIWGGISSLASKVRGIRGCVTNGLIRDVKELLEIGVPVFASGVSMRSPVKRHPGWCEIPIVIGGSIVNPGDFIFADCDGAVVLPASASVDILEKTQRFDALRRRREDAVRGGAPLSVLVPSEAPE